MLHMRMQMKLEIGYFTERFPALLTRMRLLTRMDQHVVPQITLLVKSFVANAAAELLCLAVCSHVGFQRRRSVERFAAHGALVRALRRVDDFVTAKCRRQTETFAAY